MSSDPEITKLQEAFKIYVAVLTIIAEVESSNNSLTYYCGKTLYRTIIQSKLPTKAKFILDEDRFAYEYGYTKKSDLTTDVDTFFET